MARLLATNFQGLDSALGRRDARTIGNNTTAERDFGTILVRLHGHAIARLFEDGSVTVSDAGWQTVTAKESVNQFLPRPFRVEQKNRTWNVHNIGTGEAWPFTGVFSVAADGRPVFGGLLA